MKLGNTGYDYTRELGEEKPLKLALSCKLPPWVTGASLLSETLAM
jgi:hypothetical protein